jgi:hypothetical protein
MPFFPPAGFLNSGEVGGEAMGLRDDGEGSKLLPGNPRLGQTTGSISSLNEAWFHTLDRCVINGPLSEVILPLMRNCFFCGAMHAVLLLQKGHGDQLASDIAGFIIEEPQS